MSGPVVAVPLIEAGAGVPDSPRAFEFLAVDMWTAARLNRAWHSMLPRTDVGNLLCGNTSAAFAAEYENRYFAVAIFSQPISRHLCDGKTIELRRLAICDVCPKNTATRMLSKCLKLVKAKYPQMVRCVSYQAVDVHAGTIYKAGNWKPVGAVSEARPQRLPGGKQRATGPLQTTSRKQRWEIEL